MAGIILPPKPKLISRRAVLLGAPALILARKSIITPAEAALSGWSTSNYIESTTGVITATPLTMACWLNPSSLAALQIPLGVFASGSTVPASSFRMQIQTTGAVRAVTNASSAESATISTSTWSHICGVFTSATSRSAYVNGGSKATDTTSATPAGLNRMTVGVGRGSTVSNPFTGSIAEVGIWNAALTDDEVAALGKGFSPRLIRPSALVAYLPIVRDFVDVKGAGFSVTGSLTVGDHSPVRY